MYYVFSAKMPQPGQSSSGPGAELLLVKEHTIQYQDLVKSLEVIE